MQFGPLDLSYVVPVRWRDGAQRQELAEYLAEIAPLCAEVIVVDGSEPDVFAANAAAWGAYARHVPPAQGEESLMGKVAGVRTGVRLAAHERVVIADDDVRYEPEALRRTAELLETYDLVRPQNYFDRLPWHARWDTARTLLNRSLGRDFPGTLAVRRSRMLAMGMYDGDVLFENLELMRTVRAHGGSVVSPLDLYVARVPPSASHFGRARPTTTSRCRCGWRSGWRWCRCSSSTPRSGARHRWWGRPLPRSPRPRSGAAAPGAPPSSRRPPRCWRRSGSSSAASAPGSRSASGCASAASATATR
jgi:hypothetical protein